MTAACPACIDTGDAVEKPDATSSLPTHELVLPTIHCMACIKSVEGILTDQPGIMSARVNLSRKRVAIFASQGEDPTAWIEALTKSGFEAYEARQSLDSASDAKLLLRLGVAGFAMMNVMLLSVAVWSGAGGTTRELFHWIAAAIALPTALFCAEPFFRHAASALRAGRLNMDVPISLAIILASVMSLYETFTGGEHAYFDAALSLTFFLLAGRYLETRMRQSARSAAADLAALEPGRVTCLVDGERVSRPVDEVKVNDVLALAAGARVPVDGYLKEGQAQVDRSALTGESEPVSLAAGGELISGDVLLTGPHEVIATRAAQHSTLRKMIELAERAEGARTRYTGLADKAAKIYAPLVHGLALAGFLGWYFWSGDLHHAAMVAISTLIITCPCALGLAVPAVATVATGRMYRKAILVKSETALERLAEVDTVVFDKTGTLTRASLSVPKDLPRAEKAVLKTLAAASDHPLSASLVHALGNEPSVELDQIKEQPGRGLEASWQGMPVAFGSGRWLGSDAATCLRVGSRIYALAHKEDIAPGAIETVAALQKQGFEVHMLTGDKRAHADHCAAQLHLGNVHSELQPADKLEIVQGLEAKGQRVLMVGDGLNDTLALSAAHASAAPGNALEASQNAADVVFLNGDLTRLLDALRISKRSVRRILENFGLAGTYNAISIPLALAGFATPLLAALAMSTSSILVTLNALRVR